MEISKRIVVAFVSVALIPILAISGISGVTIFNLSNENAADASAALRAEELANLERVANDTALFIQERVQNYIDGVYMMEKYAEDLFNDRINATPQHSYYWDWEEEYAETGMLVPGRHYEERYGSSDISFNVSCYYMPRPYYKTPGDPFDWSASTEYFLNTSSNMDNVYRALHKMSSDYIWLYMGFDPSYCDSHLFRNYPYDNLAYFQGSVPAEDYDPPAEEWYTNALLFSNDSIAFTGPYLDPSTGLVISMARPVRFDNNSIFGVVSADVTLETVLQSVLNVRVLTSGYAFLMERNSELVAHPGFTEEGQTIYDLEFVSPTGTEANAFKSVIASALSAGSGQSQYYKNGQLWYMTYAVVPSTGFLLAVVVPASEVVAPAAAILATVTNQTFILTLMLVGVLVLVAGVVGTVAYRRGRAVVEPVREMTKLVQKMSTQDFTRGVSTSGTMYEEIGTTVDALLSFQEACKFGNEAFIRGDLRRALLNYENLLEISGRLKIEEGQQTMLLNIGNVYRQRGDTTNALDY
ncbi:MAG: cache domain-containing protein, partial [Candidatus Thorarchaeota archaeon]|nr:cache domain-containing protein [Candidatus Thorarchaeota archaeon]